MDLRGWHVTMRLKDDWVIARDIAARRRAARIFIEHGEKAGLIAFDVPDTHSHAGLLCEREAAGEFAQRVQSALKQQLRLPAGFEPARIRPIGDYRHMRNVFGYILGNTPKHGVQSDPCREASSLRDLFGLRNLGAYLRARVRNVLPRIDRQELLPLLGVPRLEPGSDPRLAPVSAAAAACLPDLNGRSERAQQARWAAIRAALDLGMTASRVAELLELSLRQVQRLLQVPPAEELLRAVLLQIGLREQVAPFGG